jgi:hypothetical protein
MEQDHMRYQQDHSFHRFTIARLISILAGAMIFASVCLAASGNGPGASAKKPVESSPKKTVEKNDEVAASEPATRTGRRDPFVIPTRVKKEPPKPKVTKEPQPILPPGAEMRLAEYRSLVRQASLSNQSAPSVLSPYLIEELTINGIFRTGTGYGAFVVEGVSSKKMTLFARPGMKTYDGLVKEVTPNGVRFVKSVRFDNGAIQQREIFAPLAGRGVPSASAPETVRPPTVPPAETKNNAADEQRKRTTDALKRAEKKAFANKKN